MDTKMQQELQELVKGWYQSKNLTHAVDVIVISIPSSSTTTDNHEEEWQKDGLALMAIVDKMDKKYRVRMLNGLNNLNVTCLSQVKAQTSWDRRNLGRKTLAEFARVLRAEGINCFVTQNYHESEKPPRKPDLELCTLQPLSAHDFESMLLVFADQEQQSLIKVMQKNENRPTKASKAFRGFKNNTDYPNFRIDAAGMNSSFRQKKLPYRVKVDDLPASGNQEDRLVQIVMMPST